MKTAQERNLLAEATELGLTVRFSHARPAGEYVVTAPGRATQRPAAKGGETICCLMRTQHNPDSGEDELKTILVAYSRCNPRDTFNKGIGRAISLGRAMSAYRDITPVKA